jgi:hypothetical protein
MPDAVAKAGKVAENDKPNRLRRGIAAATKMVLASKARTISERSRRRPSKARKRKGLVGRGAA